MFMSAIALAGAFGSPFSGWIMAKMGHTGGLANWQWLFLLEGIPSTIAGIVARYYLSDGPASALWLKPEERELVTRALAREEALKRTEADSSHSLMDAFTSPKVWWFCLIYFGVVVASYFVGFWMPEIIKASITKDPMKIGFISVIPWGNRRGDDDLVWSSFRQDR